MRYFLELLLILTPALFLSSAPAQRWRTRWHHPPTPRSGRKLSPEVRALLDDARDSRMHGPHSWKKDRDLSARDRGKAVIQAAKTYYRTTCKAPPDSGRDPEVYTANAAAFGGQTLAQVLNDIVEFLKHKRKRN